jgi:hypothetical protein
MEAWDPAFSRQTAQIAMRLLVLCDDRALHPRNIPGTHFSYMMSQSQDHSAAVSIR